MVAILRLGAAASLLFGLASQAIALSSARNHTIPRALTKDSAFEHYLNRRDVVEIDERDLEELAERYYDHLQERASRGRGGSPPPYNGRPDSPRPSHQGSPPRYNAPAGAPPRYTQLSRIREGKENKKKPPTKNQKKQAKREGRNRRKQRAKKEGRRSLMDESDWYSRD